VSGTRATAVEASTPVEAATTETAASTTASERVVGNQACTDKNGCGQADQSITKHGRPPDDWSAVRPMASAMMLRQRDQHPPNSLRRFPAYLLT
jgi:hypothetical protein